MSPPGQSDPAGTSKTRVVQPKTPDTDRSTPYEQLKDSENTVTDDQIIVCIHSASKPPSQAPSQTPRSLISGAAANISERAHSETPVDPSAPPDNILPTFIGTPPTPYSKPQPRRAFDSKPPAAPLSPLDEVKRDEEVRLMPHSKYL